MIKREQSDMIYQLECTNLSNKGQRVLVCHALGQKDKALPKIQKEKHGAFGLEIQKTEQQRK